MKLELVDLNNIEHCKALIHLIDAYMQDEMGKGAPMPEGLSQLIIEGLKNQKEYFGFFVMSDHKYIALANCYRKFSTFKAKSFINIHDFFVLPEYRKKGVGKYLLNGIEDFARELDFCRINLEVRIDNNKAQNLYKKMGFNECTHPMYFWEKIF